MEETGLDMRSSMHRLVPVDMEAMGEKGQKLHQSRRRFFRLDINDSDSVLDIPNIGNFPIKSLGMQKNSLL